MIENSIMKVILVHLIKQFKVILLKNNREEIYEDSLIDYLIPDSNNCYYLDDF